MWKGSPIRTTDDRLENVDMTVDEAVDYLGTDLPAAWQVPAQVRPLVELARHQGLAYECTLREIRRQIRPFIRDADERPPAA